MSCQNVPISVRGAVSSAMIVVMYDQVIEIFAGLPTANAIDAIDDGSCIWPSFETHPRTARMLLRMRAEIVAAQPSINRSPHPEKHAGFARVRLEGWPHA